VGPASCPGRFGKFIFLWKHREWCWQVLDQVIVETYHFLSIVLRSTFSFSWFVSFFAFVRYVSRHDGQRAMISSPLVLVIWWMVMSSA